jgi:hypothetical protein
VLSRSVGQLYGSSELSDVVVEAVRARMLPPAHNPPTPHSIPLSARYEDTALRTKKNKHHLGSAQRARVLPPRPHALTLKPTFNTLSKTRVYAELPGFEPRTTLLRHAFSKVC